MAIRMSCLFLSRLTFQVSFLQTHKVSPWQRLQILQSLSLSPQRLHKRILEIALNFSGLFFIGGFVG